jgi:hypothetical protein
MTFHLLLGGGAREIARGVRMASPLLAVSPDGSYGTLLSRRLFACGVPREVGLVVTSLRRHL